LSHLPPDRSFHERKEPKAGSKKKGNKNGSSSEAKKEKGTKKPAKEDAGIKITKSTKTKPGIRLEDVTKKKKKP